MALAYAEGQVTNLHIAVTITSNVPGNPFFDTGKFDIALFIQTVAPDPVGNLLTQGGWEDADTWMGLIDPYVVARDQYGSEVLDGPARATVYTTLQRDVSGLLDIAPVYMTADITLTKPGLCNFKKWPLNGFNLWNIADWYVAPSCPA